MIAGPLVSATALREAMAHRDVALVDCRFSLADPGAGERAWREGHLPGAAYLHLDRDLSDHRKPASQGRHPLPDAAEFTARLGQLGITPETPVVAYDAGDGAMAAARLWWLLRLLGHVRVAVLDGGVAAWREAGGALDACEPRRAPAHYAGQFDERQVVGTDEVVSRLGEPPGWLLDARAAERFRGEVEPLDPVAGHIPGAINRPFAENLENGRFKPAEVLAREFGVLLAGRAPADLVLSCGSGVTACHHALALAQAGFEGARIYAPSWSGWVSDCRRPVATGA